MNISMTGIVPLCRKDNIQIMAQVKTKGNWEETTIWRHLMSTVVNLVPAKYEWTNKKFLFLRLDGRYELYDPQRYPETIE
jgi:glutathione peroxidase-family protein